MGNLVTETPYSEITATLEVLDRFGVGREQFANVRKDEKLALQVASAFVGGKQAVGNLIDCDAKPFEPSGLTVAPELDQLPNRVRGQLVWDPAKVKLYLSQNQMGGKYIEGNKLREELANQPVLNANVLDYLLKQPHLIPDEWKKDANGNTRYIFFWGTIYRDPDGFLCVRYLYFDGGGWGWHCHWLVSGWHGDYPAALRAS